MSAAAPLPRWADMVALPLINVAVALGVAAIVVALVGQPTRGVDIGAIEFIHGQLRAMRAAGCAVLVVSSELEEILALCDRVLVLWEGRLQGELAHDRLGEHALMQLMTGGGA